MALTSEELLAHNAKMSEIESEIENGLAKGYKSIDKFADRIPHSVHEELEKRGCKFTFFRHYATYNLRDHVINAVNIDFSEYQDPSVLTKLLQARNENNKEVTDIGTSNGGVKSSHFI
ncbi:hypothetical protein FACS189425_01570 [Clostridia bacterium]|nr:hypothetical protein FACS189425_01570 [Clostridia bacterium]